MKIVSTAVRNVCAIAAALALGGCSGVGGIDPTLATPISNDDAYSTIGHLWAGARSALLNKREPGTDIFNLALSYQLPCTRGGQGSYLGTISGTKTAGRGTATLALTGTATACQFDDISVVRTVTASGVTVTGTVAVVNDAWDAINIHLVATGVTVNGVSCPGGIDVNITGPTPSSQPVSSGTACGRTGAVALP